MPRIVPVNIGQRLGDETVEQGAAAASASANSAESRGVAVARLGSFDPAAFAKRTADALVANESERFGNVESQRKFSLNRRGLIGSDVGAAAGRRDFNQRVATGLDALAVQSAGQEQTAIGQGIDIARGDEAASEFAHTNYADLLSGARDYQLAQQNAKTQKTLGFINAGANIIKSVGSLFSPLKIGG